MVVLIKVTLAAVLKSVMPLVLFLMATFTHAQETTVPAKLPTKASLVASIVASPNACTLEPLEEVCEMTFHVIWDTPEEGNYCLFEDNEDEPLKCWIETNRGSVELEFSGHILEEYKMYLLLNSKTEITVATVTVPISGTLKQRQRAQRRRRGFWRMF